jgi:excisionase family DNA binding protein
MASGGSARHLDELRRLAARHGIPLACLDRLGLRPREASRLLGVGERTIRGLLDSGALPAARVGGAVVIPVLNLLRFLDDHPYSNRQKGRESVQDRAADFIEGLP